MKLSLDWIGDYVDLPADLDPDRIAHDLTMATVEVEGVMRLADRLANVVVGQIDEVGPHPDADKLRVVTCSLGEGRTSEIVCGGSNLSAGMKVAVAVPGAKVRWHGEGDLVEIRKSKVRGVASDGMICGANEIGLSDLFPVGGEAEILELSNVDATPGDSLAAALDMDDVIFEIDNKSLTNRPDLWGHYGVARELAALYQLELKPLPSFSTTKSGGIGVEIIDSDVCRRYAGVAIAGVSVVKSPFWMASRLARIGQRPINLLVDLTNYVMFALGQPCHAFDRSLVKGTISVRRGSAGEPIALLDGSELKADESDLLIADEEGPIALAGVMGGARASIPAQTREMVLEVANFEAPAIRRMVSRYGLRTESSTRFEKSLDPGLVADGIALFVELLRAEQPDIEITGFADCFPRPLEKAVVEVPTSFLQWRLGKELPESEIRADLLRLGFESEANDGQLRVAVPSWRATGDVKMPEDLVEEVARLYGYENFEFVPPHVDLTRAINQPRVRLEREIKEYLAYRGGMQEVFSYPWVEDVYLQAAGMADEACLALAAPPSPETRRLKPSLIPQLLKAIASNLRYYPHFRLFELTRVFRDQWSPTPESHDESLPQQPKMLAGAFVGDDAKEMFLAAKGVLHGLGQVAPLAPIEFASESATPWAAPNLQLALVTNGQAAGSLGVVSSGALRKAGIKHVQVAMFEIDVEALLPQNAHVDRFVAIPEYPRVDYDLSLLFDEHVPWEQVRRLAGEADERVQSVSFTDEYHGQHVPEGKKSLTLSLTLGSPSGTLTSEQIEKSASAVIEQLSKQLGGQLRGS